MIDGARRFAVRWLLDPTISEIKARYELVLSLANYCCDDEQTYKSIDYTYINDSDSRYGNNINQNIQTHALAGFSKFANTQIKIYKIAKTREYLGSVMYFNVGKALPQYRYIDRTPPGKEIYKESYYYSLLPVTRSNKNNDFAYMRGGVLDESKIVTNYYSGELIYQFSKHTDYQKEAYTSEFYNFSEKTSIESTVFSNQTQKIIVRHFSRGKYENVTVTTEVTPNGTTSSSSSDIYPEVTDGSFLTYLYNKNSLDNFYTYQDKFNQVFESKQNIPNILIKCFDGLDYNSFMNLYDLTSNFSQNTTITFEYE